MYRMFFIIIIIIITIINMFLSCRPMANVKAPLKALIFDSWYDSFYGVICLVLIKDGKLMQGDEIELSYSKKKYVVEAVGIMHPELVPTHGLMTGQVGFLICDMRTTKEARIGETIYHVNKPVEPLPGFKAAKPMVFAGIYPMDSGMYHRLKDSIDKLLLSDASVTYTQETSLVLGSGFRCGFLGLLHMDGTYLCGFFLPV